MDKTRRNLLKGGAIAAGAATFAAGYSEPLTRMAKGLTGSSGEKPKHPVYGNALDPEYRVDLETGDVTPNPDQRVAFTVCYGCTTKCGVRVRIDNRSETVLRSVGNPFNPLSADEHADETLPVKDALLRTTAFQDQGWAARSTTCARGNAMIAQITSPHRITQCLKRAGKRGEGKWETISFEQLIEEIVEGGDLFGEGHVDGLAAINDYDTPLDPENPEYGPKTNQLLVMEATDYGRSAVLRRFSDKAFGTRNYGHHGSYCGLAFRMGAGAMMNDLAKNAHLKPDFEKATFGLFIGTAPSQAGNPFKRQGRLLSKARVDETLEYIVVDPALNASVARAAGPRANWVPIRPGSDTALGMALMRLLFETEGYAAEYLAIPNAAAAKAAGEPSHSNAVHLVITSDDHPRAGAFLRESDLGLKPADAEDDAPMVMDATGAIVPANTVERAELFTDAKVTLADGNSVDVRSSLRLLRDEALSHPLEEMAGECGVSVEQLQHMAGKLKEHGRTAAVDCHGGMMSGAGFYSAYALQLLNVLVGNVNHTGGSAHGGGKFNGAGKGPRYNLAGFKGARKPKGVFLSRSRFPYEKTSEFKRLKAEGKSPYPARAPWRRLAPPVLTDHITAAIDGYPYPIKAMIGVMCNPIYGQAGLKTLIADKLRDPKVLPLYVAVDGFINETNTYADYIVPDSVMYEVWGFTGAWSGNLTKMTTACWPIVEPRQAKTADGQPVSMESFFIKLAKRLGLDGFGDNAITDAEGGTHPLNRAEDFYLRAAANIAFMGKPLPDASEDDIRFSGLERLLPEIEATLPAEERGPVAHLYSRGGRYQTFDKARDGEALGNPWKRTLCVWNEKVGTCIDSMTGKRLFGTARFLRPAMADGSAMRDHFGEADWPMLAFSYKSNVMNSYSVGLERLRMIKPYNPILVNHDDAERLGIAHGAEILVESPGGRLRGLAIVTKGVMPGAIGIEHSFGHTELGARDHVIDGETVPGNPWIAAGVNINDLGFADPTRKTLGTWLEPVSGASVRQGLPVRISAV
ncbi:tetrathionate reductase subunit TtrA [Stappia taiwanensis]|uniref:Tetrathionate reductase subunit TtrA n=1 Tax=Stappia taiwanensis TaxID=992267 RepID=A0A838XJQ0_9HYPH|nr:molybdopterin dinucleotide binding domain-containing protein [Stappia taiwanensis]MBA4610097.1 tetrathionate reductase subunit TtrA [Stappia taiwanensis]GGE76893.1 tetrathionate reductase subunit A [Stappia taiwanensis]